MATAEIFEDMLVANYRDLRMIARDPAIAQYEMVVRRAADSKGERLEGNPASASVRINHNQGNAAGTLVRIRRSHASA